LDLPHEKHENQKTGFLDVFNGNARDRFFGERVRLARGVWRLAKHILVRCPSRMSSHAVTPQWRRTRK
jgi:hypothetical protein